MYPTILALHSYLAYIVLAVLIVAVVNAIMGFSGNKLFTLEKDFRIGLFALIFAHLQLLVGLILYFISPNGEPPPRGFTLTARIESPDK